MHNGVIYISTGADDVFAIDVETGQILWKYEANLDQKIDTVCCGWTTAASRSATARSTSASSTASSSRSTRRPARSRGRRRSGRWQDGYTITSAPLYYNGMVITGISGGEFGDPRPA